MKKIILASSIVLNSALAVSLSSIYNAQNGHIQQINIQINKANIAKALLQNHFLDTANQNFQLLKNIKLIHYDFLIKTFIAQSNTESIDEKFCKNGTYKGGICNYYLDRKDKK